MVSDDVREDGEQAPSLRSLRKVAKRMESLLRGKQHHHHHHGGGSGKHRHGVSWEAGSVAIQAVRAVAEQLNLEESEGGDGTNLEALLDSATEAVDAGGDTTRLHVHDVGKAGWDGTEKGKGAYEDQEALVQAFAAYPLQYK